MDFGLTVLVKVASDRLVALFTTEGPLVKRGFGPEETSDLDIWSDAGRRTALVALLSSRTILLGIEWQTSLVR